MLDFSLYEPGTRRELMRGRVKIAMSGFDMSKSHKEPDVKIVTSGSDMSKSHKEPDYNPLEFNFEFPRTHPVPVVEEPKSTFRQRFVKYVADGLVQPFTPHYPAHRTIVDE